MIHRAGHARDVRRTTVCTERDPKCIDRPGQANGIRAIIIHSALLSRSAQTFILLFESIHTYPKKTLKKIGQCLRNRFNGYEARPIETFLRGWLPVAVIGSTSTGYIHLHSVYYIGHYTPDGKLTATRIDLDGG